MFFEMFLQKYNGDRYKIVLMNLRTEKRYSSKFYRSLYSIPRSNETRTNTFCVSTKLIFTIIRLRNDTFCI